MRSRAGSTRSLAVRDWRSACASASTVASFLLFYALHVPVVVPFTRLIARLPHAVLQTMGARSWVSGASVGIPGFAVEIKNNCNAIYEIGLYAKRRAGGLTSHDSSSIMEEKWRKGGEHGDTECQESAGLAV